MTRNEAKYTNPERFQPERFLLENGELNEDTMGYAYGAGRRICVGRHVGDASVWSAIASILSIFKIVPCKDEQGNEIPVNPRWTVGVTSYVTLLLEKDVLTPAAQPAQLAAHHRFSQAPSSFSMQVRTAGFWFDGGEVGPNILSILVFFWLLARNVMLFCFDLQLLYC